MSDWSHGYDVSTEYSYGFYREMAPDWLDLCAWIGGFEPPRRSDGAFRYLDLGCGQGFGVCLLAAANPEAEFVGVDFQPEHIGHAQRLADAGGLSNVRFVQADFLDLAAQWPKDFGTFDYIALHGILSWISAGLRDAVVQCLSRATAPGGLVYVSYNAMPGCLSTVPLQHFALRIKEAGGGEGARPVEEAIGLLDRLAAANAPVFQVLPALKSRLDALRTRDRNYLAHEYLTESWTPFWHSEVARAFGQAGLGFVASATLADNLVPEFLPPPLHQVIAESSDELRQDLQDFIINQAFRRDIFCRGASPAARDGTRGRLPVYLAASPDADRPMNFETSFGQVGWEPAVFTPIVEAVASGPRPLDDLFRLPNSTPWRPRHILLLLLHANVLAHQAAGPADPERAQRFNAAVAAAASRGAPYEYLAAARLGSAVRASASELSLLDGWLKANGTASASDLAGTLDGSTSLAEAADFLAATLPRWRQLGVLV